MNIPSWHPDPHGRHERRWWDGSQWTDQVADDGKVGFDPLEPSGEDAAAPPESAVARTSQGTDREKEAEPSRPAAKSLYLASSWKRVGAYLLDAIGASLPVWIGLDAVVLALVLAIGYWAWSFCIYDKGQSPAKQLLGLRVIEVSTRRCVNWGSMAEREFLMKGVVVEAVVSFLVIKTDASPLVAAIFVLIMLAWFLTNLAMLFLAERHRTAWDMVLGTMVIDDPDGEFDPRRWAKRRRQASRRSRQRAR
ncbi:MAG: RDD family protein [bacterium]|nr:RDD family protein [bacterium]